VQTVRRADDLEHALGQFDAGIDLAGLLVAVVDRRGIHVAAPLDVERHRHQRPERPLPDLGRIVEQHTMSLVADAPLPERHVALVVSPHLRRLDLETLPQTRTVELLDVEIRLAAAHQPGPVVEAAAAQLEADEHAGARCHIRSPPPPGFDGDIVVAAFVGGSEQHLDPAD